MFCLIANRCTITLSTLPVLLSKNAQLHATVDELSRRTKAAEMEARDLGEYNSQLAGNDNPLAKIDFLAKVRGELMDSRKVRNPFYLSSLDVCAGRY